MSISKMDLAIRLVEERTKLGFSQADMARKAGISREGLRLYETAQRGIAAEFLSVAATLGVDVQYVISGVHSANLKAVEAAVAPAVTIGGSNTNVIGLVQSGATVHQIHTQRNVVKTTADVKPGVEHITEENAVSLTALVNKIVETETKLKKNPTSHRAVWGALNSHCNVTRYRLIQLADFERAQKYLHQWLGRINSMASAPVKDGDVWRNRRYAYIKINSKDDPNAVTKYIKRNFNAESLTTLSNDELERVYRYVAGRKKT